MKDKKVVVLLSAYNGEEYIGEQIDSILQQDWGNVSIWVRDDGSKDQTVSILERYEKDGRVHLKRGENLGFIGSFFWLVANCEEGDYYAYSDQDDVWFPNKLSMAMERMEKEKQEQPLLYFSNYDYYDGQLNFLSHGDCKRKYPTFPNALVDCMPLGFNSVFNQAAMKSMREHLPKHSCGHDWWTYLVCQGIGKVIYDERPTVKYRRHDSNVSPGGMAFWKHQVWRFRKFFLGDYFTNVRRMLQEYEKYYGEQLSTEDKATLSLFTKEHYHLKTALKKVFFPKRFRQNTVDELMVRVLFLIGRL